MSEGSLNITPHNPSNSNGEVHTHSHASGTPDTASHHAHEHSHSHTHSPAEMRKIVNSLSRSIGHLEAVKRMIENGQDCSDVLIQLAAVKAEINNAGKALLKEHLEHCIVEAVEEQDEESIEKVNKAIDQFIR